MPHHRFPVEIAEGVPVMAAPEEIDITNATALRSALFDAATGHHATLVVDMTLTQFCDMSGLHALVAAHKRAKAEGREVVLVVACTPVLRVLSLTGIDGVIHSFSSLAAALAYAHRRDDRVGLGSDPMTRPTPTALTATAHGRAEPQLGERISGRSSVLDHTGQIGTGLPSV
ncbi:MAG TPA: STAS domain-containing protein [Streptosporangiaceae bacterium]|jgi:anti-sigma B factor antagonist|nr:STAS domain-containing protein [Streptosporangiaceae bacterium]